MGACYGKLGIGIIIMNGTINILEKVVKILRSDGRFPDTVSKLDFAIRSSENLCDDIDGDSLTEVIGGVSKVSSAVSASISSFHNEAKQIAEAAGDAAIVGVSNLLDNLNLIGDIAKAFTKDWLVQRK